MRNLISRRLNAADEDGVTLVIVALCLIALFGMLVLVVDVGGLLLNRREMVNASDAAALSAAKSCILPASKDQFLTAEAAADTYALDNSPRAKTAPTNIIQVSGCETRGNGYVTVQYSADQHLFFAPVLGAGGNGQVTTQATAIFGPSGRASPLPIVLYDQAFNNCKLKQQIDPNATCYVWEDNSNTQGAQASFGLLDLRTDDPTSYGWNSNPGVSCSNPGGAPDQWINNYQSSPLPDLPSNYPAPTYVCRVDGFQQNAWADLQKLVDDNDVADNNDQEDILYFPLNRCETPVLDGSQGGQIERINNSQWQEVPCSQTPTQFDIIGFVAAKLIQIYDPNQVQGSSGTCNKPRDMPGVNNGVFDLNTFGTFNGCFATSPDTISNVTLQRSPGTPQPDPVQCPTLVFANGCDWTYDPTSRTVSWNVNGPAKDNASFDVKFDWQIGGACGIPPSGGNSGHCLILQPVEVQVGGSGAGTGSPDSNLRSYRLCEPAIPGSCAPITVPVP